MDSIGLKNLRRQLGYSQSEMAKALNLGLEEYLLVEASNTPLTDELNSALIPLLHLVDKTRTQIQSEPQADQVFDQEEVDQLTIEPPDAVDF